MTDKSAAEQALDDIAAICGCPHWDYPGQVVRDVAEMKERARVRIRDLKEALNAAIPQQESIDHYREVLRRD